jgi:C4-dicarboxylate transporter DctQ subunit
MLVRKQVENQMKILDRINDYIDVLVKWILIILMLVIPAVMMLQVVVRYVFNYPLSWPEEFARICFIWVVFMSACAALRRGEVVALDFLISRFNHSVAFVLKMVGRIGVLVFLSFATYSSYDMMAFVFKRGSYTAAMEFPLWIVYLALPLGCVFMFYQLAVGLAHEIIEKWRPEH